MSFGKEKAIGCNKEILKIDRQDIIFKLNSSRINTNIIKGLQ